MTGSEIRKIDAARRQLDEAIRLWMEEREPLAIHTLTMAAFGVLYDVAKHHKVIKDGDVFTSLLSQKGHSKFRELASFLKHADRDPLASYPEPEMEEHEYRIGLAIVLYRGLLNEPTPEMGAFHLTMITTYPELFQLPPDPDTDVEEGFLRHAALSRESWEMRRRAARGFLECIKSGVLPANTELRRVPPPCEVSRSRAR